MSKHEYAARRALTALPSPFSRAVRWLLAPVLCAFVVLTADAAEHRFHVLLDTDNASGTGCTVSTAAGNVGGIEQVWTTVVTTSPSGATVTRIERQTCAGTVLSAATLFAAAGWPAGIGNGTQGVAALETFIPLAALPAGGTMKAYVASVNAGGGQDATAAFTVTLGAGLAPATAAPIPLAHWLVIPLAALVVAFARYRRGLRSHFGSHGSLLVIVLLVAASGLVLAASVNLDGNVGDWAGATPVAGNARGSAPVDANIVAVFVQSDAANFYLRIDADVRADSAGNQPPVPSAGPDQTIVLSSSAALAGSATDDGLPNPPGALTTTWSKVSGPGIVTFGNAGSLATTAAFSASGVYVLRLTASDGALSANDDVQITVNTTSNRIPVAQNDFATTTPGVAVQINVLANDSDPDGDALTVASSGQAAHGSVVCVTAGLCTYTPATGFSGQDTFSYTASDGRGGQATATVTLVVAAGDTTANAPPITGANVTLVGQASRFLYTGSNPLQTGVAAGTIDDRTATVLRGKVTDRAGNSLPGIAVSIVDHPEFGQTRTRSNGFFDMVVNGGRVMSIAYSATGFLKLHKQVAVPWQNYLVVPSVVLIAVDDSVSAMTANAPTVQVHRASMASDSDGSRTATVIVPAGTTATMTFADSSTQPLTTMHVRATEYTVGSSGPAAMPASLPPLSGYTYCVELSLDEALAADATGVVFSQPVITYLENFLNFPVGTNVPVGIYDRAKAMWVPSANGRVVKIIGITGGLADVDTDGDNIADNAQGITGDERRQLASMYAVGQTLWRTPVSHFSPADSNWPFSIPPDATTPGNSGAGPDQNDPLQKPNCSSGSIIECENQVLGEMIPIVGTPFTLNYRSDRVPGQSASRNIVLSGPSVPGSLQSISLHTSVAGQTSDQTFPASANQKTRFTWDRLDAYGRPTVGGQTLNIKIDYNYPTMYQDPGPLPGAFNSVGGVTLGGNRARQSVSISQSFTTTIGEGLTDARTIGLGGWTLDAHHTYDPTARVVNLGNGSRGRAASIARILNFADLTGQSILFDVEVGSDGAQYVALPHGDQIVRIAPDGTQSIFAGNGAEGFAGDGGPATQAMLGDPTGLSFAPDGSLYVAEESNQRVRRIAPDGTISTVAGNGATGLSGDGGPALQTHLSLPIRVAVAPDSSFYILDANSRVHRVTTDGVIHLFAGTGVPGFAGDGGPATSAAINALGLATAPDGSVYIADFGNHRVRRVGTDGVIRTVADYTSVSGEPASVRVAPDGGVLIGVEFTSARTPQVDVLKPDGTLVTVAGGGPTAIQQGLPSLQANLGTTLRGVAVAPDGTIFIAPGDGNDRLLRVGTSLPGFSGSQIPIVSPDGTQLYVFDANGRHLETRDALTGTTLLVFGYDTNGRLTQVTQRTGGVDNVTTIQRNGSGTPTAIIGPFGQTTSLGLDTNGFLNAVTNPAGESIHITSDAGGLMTSYTNPRGKTSSFAFDTDGRLTHDADAGGGTQDLARTTTQTDATVTRTTALSRTTTFRTQNLAGNAQDRTTIAPDGTQTLSHEVTDAGTTHTTSADGSRSDTQIGPDPRYGMQAPIVNTATLTLPSSLTVRASKTRAAQLSNPADPLSVVTLTDTATIANRTTRGVYTAATRTTVLTTAAGRATTFTGDAFGRPVFAQSGNLAPANATYDSHGRISSFTQGTGAAVRSYAMTYNALGYLQSASDPLGRAVQFTYDAAGRMATRTTPDGRVTQFAYDPAGNLASVTPPGRPAHTFAYSDRNELTSVDPPVIAGTGSKSYAYNVDGQTTSVTYGDGRSISFAFDTFGRLATRTLMANGHAVGEDTFHYDGAGRLSGVDGIGGETTTYAYDGSALTGTAWSGPVAGSVTRVFDNSLRLVSDSVNAAAVAYTYDDDNLLTGAGALSIARDASTGLATSDTLGSVATAYGYNAFGETTSKTTTAGATQVMGTSYVRNGLGRIARRTETLGATTRVYDYTYDVAGQLTSVALNGTVVEAYAYDVNGNRTSATVGGVTIAATYDAQDRLVQYGPAAYAFDGAGDLVSKTVAGQVTRYQYDQRGRLTAVTMPNGTAIGYVVDAAGRRVGKQINAALVKGFLYLDSLHVAAELDGAGNVVARFIYADGNAPRAMIKGGATFRIVTDHVGSVRLVVDAATGVVAQQIDYDTYGNVVADTNPGFQPFGFAGGLYDPDTQLVHFGLRDYEASTGRWTAKDPIGFGASETNLYRYGQNDPVNKYDPTGASVLKDIAAAIFDSTFGQVLETGWFLPILGPAAVFGPLGLKIMGLDPLQAVSDEFGLGVNTHSAAFVGTEVCADIAGSLGAGAVAGVAGSAPAAVTAALAESSAEAAPVAVARSSGVVVTSAQAAQQSIASLQAEAMAAARAAQEATARAGGQAVMNTVTTEASEIPATTNPLNRFLKSAVRPGGG